MSKKTTKTTPSKASEPATHKFDTGAVRQPLGIRWAIHPAAIIAMRLLSIPKSQADNAEISDYYVQCLFSIGALIHLAKTGELSLEPSRFAIQAYADAMTEGSAKYDEDNWRKGIPESNLVQHAVNHLMLYADGDRSEDHLAHAFWNVATAIYFCDSDSEKSHLEFVEKI